MTESMVEKVAAVFRRANESGAQFAYEDVARAAIEAMREPTPEMAEAGDEAVDQTSSDTTGHWYFSYYDGDAAKVWQSMIDAALNPQTPA